MRKDKSGWEIRWTRGELLFMIFFTVFICGLVIFSILRDAPHP